MMILTYTTDRQTDTPRRGCKFLAETAEAAACVA